MAGYREYPPPAHIADAVDCIWIMQADGAPLPHRVVPDGCADILFSRGDGAPSLTAVGTMTRYEDYELPPAGAFAGLRFRSGMWSSQLSAPADRLTDHIVKLEDLWGTRARILRERLANARSVEDWPAVLTDAIEPVGSRTTVQRAIAWMERQRGCVSLDWLAAQAGLSVRQFRRVCREQTGLTPKLLARILRFRHTLKRVRAESGDHAGLAADCGFSDQSHLIAEFRRFSGRTPASYDRGR